MILQHLTLALPQIILLVTACLCLLSELFLGNNGLRFTYAIALLGLLVAAVFSAAGIGSASIVFLGKQCVSDDLSHIMNAGIALAVLVTLVYAKDYLFERQMPVGDILLLILLSTFGMMVLVSANTLLTSYLGLELVSLPLYALTAVRRTEGNSSEAAMKYFVMGAIASGMLLYGFSLLYGATGQTVFSEIANVIATQDLRHDPLLQFALVFIVAGLGFKLAMVPFH
ncbi:MAG: proton-conducting transporter membrane subunit, partial [Methylococcales bacterium]|nr:proton-conducting transporter membrane subunit [Methylococcales bacterium]